MGEIKIRIRTARINLAPGEKFYIEGKIGALAKFLPPASHHAVSEIEVKKATRHHRRGRVYAVSVTLLFNGDTIRAEAEEVDVHAAVDEVRDELRLHLQKEKGKLTSVAWRRARAAKKDLRFSRAARLWRKGRIRQEGV